MATPLTRKRTKTRTAKPPAGKTVLVRRREAHNEILCYVYSKGFTAYIGQAPFGLFPGLKNGEARYYTLVPGRRVTR